MQIQVASFQTLAPPHGATHGVLPRQAAAAPPGGQTGNAGP